MYGVNGGTKSLSRWIISSNPKTKLDFLRIVDRFRQIHILPCFCTVILTLGLFKILNVDTNTQIAEEILTGRKI